MSMKSVIRYLVGWSALFQDAAVKQKKNKKKKAKGGAEGGAPAADGAKRVVNTSVFAQGIPRDATLEEVTAFFKKAGIPRMDEEGGQHQWCRRLQSGKPPHPACYWNMPREPSHLPQCTHLGVWCWRGREISYQDVPGRKRRL